MIPFNNRFHGHNSLNYVYKNGDSFRSRLFVLKILNNPRRKKSRAAVVVSKKVLKSAVKRNRIRRVTYEYLRLKLPKIEGVHDIVIIVLSSEVLTLSHETLVEQLDQLFSQADLTYISKNN